MKPFGKLETSRASGAALALTCALSPLGCSVLLLAVDLLVLGNTEAGAPAASAREPAVALPRVSGRPRRSRPHDSSQEAFHKPLRAMPLRRPLAALLLQA